MRSVQYVCLQFKQRLNEGETKFMQKVFRLTIHEYQEVTFKNVTASLWGLTEQLAAEFLSPLTVYYEAFNLQSENDFEIALQKSLQDTGRDFCYSSWVENKQRQRGGHQTCEDSSLREPHKTQPETQWTDDSGETRSCSWRKPSAVC